MSRRKEPAENDVFSPAMESALRDMHALATDGIALDDACAKVCAKRGFMLHELRKCYAIRHKLPFHYPRFDAMKISDFPGASKTRFSCDDVSLYVWKQKPKLWRYIADQDGHAALVGGFFFSKTEALVALPEYAVQWGFGTQRPSVLKSDAWSPSFTRPMMRQNVENDAATGRECASWSTKAILDLLDDVDANAALQAENAELRRRLEAPRKTALDDAIAACIRVGHEDGCAHGAVASGECLTAIRALRDKEETA